MVKDNDELNEAQRNEARLARNAYYRQWRHNHPDAVRKIQERYFYRRSLRDKGKPPSEM